MHRNNSTEQENTERFNGGSNISNGETGNENLLEILLRQRWVVITVTLVFLLGGIIYLMNAVPIYTSKSGVYVEQTGPKLMSEYEGTITHSKNYLNTQGEVIKSTPILAKVVEDPQIQNFRTFENVDNPVTYLKENLLVDIGKKDDIITVSFDSPYPEEAALMVNKVVNEYINYQSTQKRSTVSEVLRLLQKEKVKRDQELSEKFEGLLEFTRVNGVTAFENQGNNIVMRRLSTLSDALTKAELETISAKADLEAAEKMSMDPEKLKYLAMSNTSGTVAAITNNEEREIRSNIRELQQKLEETRHLCTNDHPLVTELVAQIEQLESYLNLGAEEFADAYIEVLRQKYETCIQREEELYASFDTQQEEAQSFGLKATEYSVLQSELERTERLCEILDGRIKELNVTEEAGALNINILEVAQVEDKPSKPEKAKVLMMSLMAGLLLGCGTALGRDWFDYRLRSVEEISAMLGVPVLGVVPKIAAAAEETIVARSKHFWDIFREQISAVKGKLAVQVSNSRTTAASSDSNIITQLVMDCGKKVADRLKPVINHACRSVGFKLNLGQQDKCAKDSFAERKNAESKQNLHENQKGWLKSQATSAEVYQQRLDRALFGSSRKQVQPASKQPVVPVVNVPRSVSQSASDRGQEILHSSRSSVAEAYRTIRTAVFFGVPKDEAKTIMVTSPAPGDGKSTLVSNLSIAMAQAGQRTLVMDCDFRKPTQQTIFNSSNKLGIANIFAENLSLDKAIQHGPVAGLDVLTRGPEVPNPCELLNSNAFTELLEKLSERYDRIIIDSAPVTAVADSQILSAVSDVTILVLRAEKSTRRMSQLAMHLLQSVNARVLGVVVNGVSANGGHYGYYYGGYGYYGKYGRYGYGEDKKAERYQHASDTDTVEAGNRYNSEVKV